MPTTRFSFGRLNLIAEYEDKEQFLLKGLKTDKLLTVRGHQWGYFEVERMDLLGGMLAGYLVKLRAVQPEEVVDLRTHGLALTDVENRVIAKSRFYMHIVTGLIAYQIVSGHIYGDLFRRYFAKLFVEGYGDFFVNADIQAVEERTKFLETLATYERVRQVTIKLHPSNPSFAPTYRRVDERLKKLQVKGYREIYSAERGEGLAVGDDEEIRSKVVMAEDGYGEARAKGMRAGHEQTISTLENPMSTQAETQGRTMRQVLDQLLDMFESLIGRGRQ